jgi:hypothetical protein
MVEGVTATRGGTFRDNAATAAGGNMKKVEKKKTSKKEQLWLIGSRYFIRTVTMYYVGELVAIDDHEVTLRDAAWVADTGRFSDALRTGNVSECEPFPDGVCGIGRGSIVDASIWPHGPLRMVIG